MKKSINPDEELCILQALENWMLNNCEYASEIAVIRSTISSLNTNHIIYPDNIEIIFFALDLAKTRYADHQVAAHKSDKGELKILLPFYREKLDIINNLQQKLLLWK